MEAGSLAVARAAARGNLQMIVIFIDASAGAR